MTYRNKANIELGDVVTDNVTGFTGTVIAKTRWTSNCDTLTVQPKEVKDGKPIPAHSFDLPNLRFVETSGVKVLSAVRPEDPVELGDQVEDTLTGVTGIAVSHTIWHNGCSRVRIQPSGLVNGVPAEPSTADEQDIKILKRLIPRPQPVKTGGPRPEPRR